MAQENWWDEDAVVSPRVPQQPSRFDRKVEADIDQTGASTANAAASARETTTLLPAKARKAEAEAATAELAVQEATNKAAKRNDTDAAAVSRLRSIIDKIDSIAIDAADNGGWFETGASGEFARNIPAWASAGATRPAHDIAANLKTIDANTAFSELQKMRENSPTGGALGNVTEKELSLLKASVANLDPNQSHPQFLGNLAAAKRSYLDMLRRLDPGKADEYALKPGIRWRDDGSAILTMASGPDDRKPEDPWGLLPAGLNGGAPGAAPPGGAAPQPGGGPAGSGGTPPAPPSSPSMFSGDYSPEALGRGLAQGAGSVVAGIGDIPGMLGGNMIGQAWYNLLRRYGQDVPASYDMGSELRKLTGLPENKNWTDSAVRGGTAALTGSLAAKGIGAGLQPGAMKNALGVMAAQPGRDMAAGAAAGGGASLARGMGGGDAAQLGAALGGGLLGYGGANAAYKALQPKNPSQMAQLAAKYNVDFLPADSGSPVARIMTGAAKASPISASPIVGAAEQAQSSLAAAAGRVAREQAGGDIPTTDQAGEFLRDAAKRYNAKTRDIGNTNYEKVWRDPAASSLTIPARNSIAKLDEMIEQLQSAPNTNSTALNNLAKLRADLAKGMTAENMHALRSEIRDGVYDGGLRSTRDQGRMKAIGAAMSDDMLGYLDRTGLGRTSNAIRKADNYWQKRVEHIDQVLQPIIGKNEQIGGEQIVSRIESMTRGKMGGNKRLSRLLANMAEPERQQVRATLIDRLGRASEGAEGEDAFSAMRFISNWDKMTPQAKATVFKDGGLRTSLDDVAELAKGMQTSEKLARYDPTNKASLAGNVSLQTGLAVLSPVSFISGIGAQYVTGKLLSSPKFARMLAKTPELKDPRTFIQQLGTLGTREPLLRADAAALQQHLLRAMGQSPAGAMAQEEVQN